MYIVLMIPNTCVRPQVCFQMVRRGECFPASVFFTFVWTFLGVCSSVFLQVAERRKEFLALIAVERFPIVESYVRTKPAEKTR